MMLDNINNIYLSVYNRIPEGTQLAEPHELTIKCLMVSNIQNCNFRHFEIDPKFEIILHYT